MIYRRVSGGINFAYVLVRSHVFKPRLSVSRGEVGSTGAVDLKNPGFSRGYLFPSVYRTLPSYLFAENRWQFKVGNEMGMHIEASCWIKTVLINKEGFKFHIAISNHIHALIACICYYVVI